jgi:hypothetical protein
MGRPAIVIRDIHRYGDDLTVPEAIGRLRGGGPVTVTVTDPAQPGGDPHGNPRHVSRITVRPALGGQPGLPPEISWEARTFEPPAGAALFAEALALASQLAGCTGPGGETALSRAAAIGAVHGQDAARRASPAPRLPPAADITARLEAGDPMACDLYATPALGGQHGICYEALSLVGDLGLTPAVERVFAAAEEAYYPRRRRSLLGRGRAHRPRPRCPAPGSQHPPRRGINPGRANARTTRPSSGKTARRRRIP